MMKMMGKVKEVQEKMKQAQEGLRSIVVEAESGGGMVKVIANGQKEIVDLIIDESIVNKEDKEMMKDLIVAAVNSAVGKAEEKAKEHIKKSTEGVIPNIPGLDISGLG